MKKFLKILLILVLIVILAAGGLFGWLTLTEYKPEPTENITVERSGKSGEIPVNVGMTLLSWNIGYAGLGKESDFFMDGGKNTQAADTDKVREYLSGIAATVSKHAPDLVLMQEVDADSKRSYRIDERAFLAEGMKNTAFALNYSCPFVPIPWPPIGRVNSGLLTMTRNLEVASAERRALPCPFTWPTRIANLKRCLLVTYLPVGNSDKQLVLINLHLEAYDDGAGKIAQTNELRQFMLSEYEKGNFVIAGGDFNQTFPGGLQAYPNTHEDLWNVGVLDENVMPEGWTLAYDLSVPTCRLLNQPYDPSDREGTQHYVIDGFILSPNVYSVLVETLDEGFQNSDHNPVRLVFMLEQAVP